MSFAQPTRHLSSATHFGVEKKIKMRSRIRRSLRDAPAMIFDLSEVGKIHSPPTTTHPPPSPADVNPCSRAFTTSSVTFAAPSFPMMFAR